ncbi:MAG: hypothetical protein UY09_C0021G0003 [Parcubacteria group bacterium GW2011_GWA2_47_8]|nr:MAG: hypothetical protein UY09_C0021G0003 [Parcubacteria group bacterium GW2011_GWA2_47_8]
MPTNEKLVKMCRHVAAARIKLKDLEGTLATLPKPTAEATRVVQLQKQYVRTLESKMSDLARAGNVPDELIELLIAQVGDQLRMERIHEEAFETTTVGQALDELFFLINRLLDRLLKKDGMYEEYEEALSDSDSLRAAEIKTKVFPEYDQLGSLVADIRAVLLYPDHEQE